MERKVADAGNGGVGALRCAVEWCIPVVEELLLVSGKSEVGSRGALREGGFLKTTARAMDPHGVCTCQPACRDQFCVCLCGDFFFKPRGVRGYP